MEPVISPAFASGAVGGVVAICASIGSSLFAQGESTDLLASAGGVIGVIIGSGVIGTLVAGLIRATASAQASKDVDLKRLRDDREIDHNRLAAKDDIIVKLNKRVDGLEATIYELRTELMLASRRIEEPD